MTSLTEEFIQIHFDYANPNHRKLIDELEKKCNELELEWGYGCLK